MMNVTAVLLFGAVAAFLLFFMLLAIVFTGRRSKVHPALLHFQLTLSDLVDVAEQNVAQAVYGPQTDLNNCMEDVELGAKIGHSCRTRENRSLKTLQTISNGQYNKREESVRYMKSMNRGISKGSYFLSHQLYIRSKLAYRKYRKMASIQPWYTKLPTIYENAAY